MSGTLFVVGTPIGNLEDITFRALRTLKEVSLIAAEDTRRTSKLLAHFEIRKPLVSLHEHNERRETPRILEHLRKGDSVALVSDAGTPGIADPGARLVHAAQGAGLPVVPIPGPSAVAAALSVSGFNADEFAFMGFVPRSGQERVSWLERLKADPRVVVFFEAPHRIERTLQDVRLTVGTRPINVSREITKIHEQLVHLPINAPDPQLQARGEFTIVVGDVASAGLPPAEVIPGVDVVNIYGRLIDRAGFSEQEATEVLNRAFRVAPAALRKALKKHRIWVKQQKGDPA